MFRLALFLLLTPLLATPCVAQQFPIMPGGELPVAAIELDKMPRKFPASAPRRNSRPS